ncbi:polar amino acid transport system substrate-binding protein [Halopseudomonas xinjiangensis]|uniref:Polar amino acid transport system substrate-binding protein n=1 Tax=Halopseudomonas xinjiangensis TaxID=487184 RepID=A0A1H1LXV1_9GAMM|nr:transporter substrate-binding domain-containing protein [Halopseudomonas xinjiangensis]SDR79102.1 polar amino acid transport system substrate-binding protein [Halopseudomonas xinjiangensis]
MKRLTIALVALMSLTVLPSQADDPIPKPLVQVGLMPFPGYSFSDEKGLPAGKTVKLTRLLLNQAGYPHEIRIMPPARIWRGLEDGTVHVWPGVISKPGLEDHTQLTDRTLGLVGINLYARPGSALPVWPDGIAGKRIILITNYTYTNDLLRTLYDANRAVRFHRGSSHTGAVNMLLRGRGDYLLDYRAQVDPIVARLGMEPLPFVQVAEQPMRFLISRKSGFADRLKNDLDRAFDELAAQGAELDVTRQ